jgi:DNA uptake protein ComE-like DNA-binding protein
MQKNSIFSLQSSAFLLSTCLMLLVSCAQKSPQSDSPEGMGGNSPSPQSATQTSSVNQAAKIDINSAPNAELDKLELPGTKPSLSERIEGGRPYKAPEDLVTKKVISPSEFKLIKNLIAVKSTK